MTVGTPGFVGARLRQARAVRGMPAVGLAELAKISRQAISQYENGRKSPSPDALTSIATALRMPESFFTRPEHVVERGPIFYRSMAAATKGARERAEGKFAWLIEIVDYLTQFVALPDSNFPDLGLPEDPLLLTDDEIETAASAVRRHWGLHDGPIGNVVRLLENQGAVLARDDLGAATLDGLSEFVISEGRPFVLIGTDKGTPARWRFDAAHELGHVVLHATLKRERLKRPEEFKRIEAQAHRFAAAFLLPLGPFLDDCFAPSLDAMRAMKPKWKVSVGMMIMRARHAGMIRGEQERALWMNYGRRGWRREEPYDAEMEIEEPRLLRRAFELILSKGAQTPDDVLSTLTLPAADIETLTGLPGGYLSDDFAQVTLRPGNHDPSIDPTATSASVIQLPHRQRKS